MKDIKNNYPLLIIICIVLLSIFGILYFDDKEEEEVIQKENNNILLNDYSRFYTIESIVYKYINLIVSNNVDDLLNVLDSNFVNNNNITKDNIYNYVNKLDGIYSFKAKKIYYEEIDKNYIKYYVYGNLIQEQINGFTDKKDYYLIVNLDIKNNLFSITPYDGIIFREVNNG